MEKITCRVRLSYLFAWVPFLNRFGWWRWSFLYLCSVFLFFGFAFKAFLFYHVMRMETRPSVNNSAFDYIGGESNTIVLPEGCPIELSYEVLTRAVFLISNGTVIHVSLCFWCMFNSGHFWGGVMGSGVFLCCALAYYSIKEAVRWCISFCDYNILAEARKRRKLKEKQKKEGERKPFISRKPNIPFLRK